MDDVCTVEVQLTGIERPEGRVVGRLFAEGDDLFAPHGRLEAEAQPGGATATLRFAAVPCGRWALMVYHDGNANGTLDHRWGLPAEPLAFSGGYTLGLLSGMPTFDKLSFSVSGTTALQLVLR
ncbi:MAG: DUF2141 domain-containing protein [Myxococcota bacterium]